MKLHTIGHQTTAAISWFCNGQLVHYGYIITVYPLVDLIYKNIEIQTTQDDGACHAWWSATKFYGSCWKNHALNYTYTFKYTGVCT